MEKKRKTGINEFFHEYEDRFNQGLHKELTSFKKITGLYADFFVGANPLGVSGSKNDEELADKMQKGYAFYKEIGITSMEIVSIDIKLLDEFHAMSTVRWRCNFVKKDNTDGNVEFDNIYFTQERENQHKVFAYITGDEQAVLKQYGLIE